MRANAAVGEAECRAKARKHQRDTKKDRSQLPHISCLDVTTNARAMRYSSRDGFSAMVEIWAGTLQADRAKLRLVLKLAPDAAAITSRFDSEDRQAVNLIVDSVTRDGRALRLEMKAVGAVYDGTVSEDGRAIEGQWSQHGVVRPLSFRRN